MKRVYDEIHGHVELRDLEVQLVDTPTFQRLRRIKQLTLAYLVYPGATHVRFSNSIGTLHLASKLASSMLESGAITREEEELLRVAALLVNLGQMPMSHALEGIFASKGLTSDDLRAFLIESSEIKDVLNDFGIDPKKVVELYAGKSSLGSVLDSEVDVNRLDYLQRDSVHTGVKLGGFDVDRLIQTVRYLEDNSIEVDPKGLYALEDFYLARLHMYEAVYYHKTILAFELYARKIFEDLARSCCEELLDVKYVMSLVNEGLFPYWDDEWFYARLYNALADPDVKEPIKDDIKNFLSRKGPKLVAEMISYSQQGGDFIESKYRKLIQYGVPEDAITLFEERVPVINRSKVRVESAQDSILSKLPDYLHIYRIYVMPPFARRARELLA